MTESNRHLVGPATQTPADAGLVRRGLLLLGGMTALVVVVLLIVLRGSDTPRSKAARPAPLLMTPMVISIAPFPATPGWPLLAQLDEQLPSAPGWEIRYNAAAALARRGSAKTPWALIREMLDPKQQERNFVILRNGRLLAHAEDAQHAVFTALAVVADWHKKQPRDAAPPVTAELQQVYDQVDRLAQEGNTQLRVQADRTRQLFFRH